LFSITFAPERHLPMSTAHAALAHARTLLFVPGNRPERFQKAITSGADGVVLDLEDSVPVGAKPAARVAIASTWAGLRDTAELPLVVRINSVETEAGRADLAWLAGLPFRPDGVMLSKAESAVQLHASAEAVPDIALLPLIESAAGLLALPRIASAPGVLRLIVGHIDFMADTGIRCTDDERELDGLRFAVAMHSSANRLAQPIDGVTVAIDDDARLHADTQRALRFGFGGKLCIHPRQLAAVHAAMMPSDPEIEWARRVLAADEASGGAAIQLDGRMIDLPVVLQARQTLARARQQ
jgi:citrate lyase subunit beta / citryl-CoA lyase